MSSLDDPAAVRGARNLLEKHLRLVPGEHVVLFHMDAGDVASILETTVRELGASCDVVPLKPWRAIANDVELARLVRERVRDAVATVYLSLDGGAPFSRVQLLIETLSATHVRHLDIGAISPRMLSTSLRADPELLQRLNERVSAWIERAEALHVSSEVGTDLAVRFDRRYPLVSYTGVPEPGLWDSVPSGSVCFYSPEVSGTYVVDLLLRGTGFGAASRALRREPLTLRLADSRVVDVQCADAELLARVTGHLGLESGARRLGFVAISTNYLTRNELGVFANDAMLPGLRLVLGFSDPSKTHAPHSAGVFLTCLGRKQTVRAGPHELVTDGRLPAKLTEGLVPFA